MVLAREKGSGARGFTLMFSGKAQFGFYALHWVWTRYQRDRHVMQGKGYSTFFELAEKLRKSTRAVVAQSCAISLTKSFT